MIFTSLVYATFFTSYIGSFYQLNPDMIIDTLFWTIDQVKELLLMIIVCEVITSEVSGCFSRPSLAFALPGEKNGAGTNRGTAPKCGFTRHERRNDREYIPAGSKKTDDHCVPLVPDRLHRFVFRE